MTIQTIEDDLDRLQDFTVDTLDEDTVIRSFILVVNQTQPGAHVTLYIDCTSYGMVATPRSMRDMYLKMDISQVELVSKDIEVEVSNNLFLNSSGKRSIR